MTACPMPVNVAGVRPMTVAVTEFAPSRPVVSVVEACPVASVTDDRFETVPPPAVTAQSTVTPGVALPN